MIYIRNISRVRNFGINTIFEGPSYDVKRKKMIYNSEIPESTTLRNLRLKPSQLCEIGDEDDEALNVYYISLVG